MSAFTTADTPVPEIALLSNGIYGVMITAAGSGYSTWRDMDVTRWRADGTRDCWGQFCYIRDLANGSMWSAGYQPVCRTADDYQAVFGVDRANFRRRDGDIETRLSVCVAASDAAEVRLITVVNHGQQSYDLDLTSYAEVCLNQRRADQSHPAFAKLFLETEFVGDRGALVGRRRPRAADQAPIFALHASAAAGSVEFETDRARFLGRGRTAANPRALDAGVRLSGAVGPVLDPVFSLRRTIHLSPGSAASVAFVTGAAASRGEALAIAERYGDIASAKDAFGRTDLHGSDELQKLGLTDSDVEQFNRLAAAVLFPNAGLRSAAAIAANRLGQPGLWPYAISGDRPIVLGVAKENPETVHQLVRWHGYARGRGMDLDLVVIDDRPGDAAERLRAELQSGPAGEVLGKPGGIFVLAGPSLSPEGRTLIEAAASAVLDGRPLSVQLRPAPETTAPPRSIGAGSVSDGPKKPVAHASGSDKTASPADLLFWNGLGGFAPDGREYVIVINGDSRPPAPWTNVLANADYGCLTTDSGLGYTWASNSQMNRLTPWSNDPVSDPPGEVVYLRDEVTGEFWTPTPLPRGNWGAVTVRHGQGYTRYSRTCHGLEQELLVLVPPEDPVKLVSLTVRNVGDQPRRLTATYFAEWVLGTVRENAPLQVVCEHDAAAGAVLARSAWGGAFADQIAFAGVGSRPHSLTADRTEFLGRNGSLSSPAAMGGAKLGAMPTALGGHGTQRCELFGGV